MDHYLTLIFSLLIGAGCFWISLKMLRIYFTVKNWNRVDAKVISKEVFLHPKYSTSRTPYGLKTEYVYVVNNTEYKGHRIYLGELAGGQVNHRKADAERRLERIQNTMSVYVNPKNPNESVMYCDGMGLYVFVFCMGLLCMLIALGILLA